MGKNRESVGTHPERGQDILTILDVILQLLNVIEAIYRVFLLLFNRDA